MFKDLNADDISRFVLESHRNLRSHMLKAMHSETTNDVISLMFTKAFEGNVSVTEIFKGWCEIQGTDVPTWKQHIQFMNLLIEHQELELNKRIAQYITV